MKIGIMGAGDVSKTLGAAWAKAGHEVMISSRRPESLRSLESEIDVRVGTAAAAAEFGEVLVLAVPYTSLEDVLRAIRPLASGKLVIDATNPLRRTDNGATERVLPEDVLAGDVTQRLLPEARVAKSFTTLWTGHIAAHAFAEPRIAMTMAADREEDRELVGKLIEAVGLEPVSLGSLADSRPLDPPSAIWNVVLTAPELVERVRVAHADRSA